MTEQDSTNVCGSKRKSEMARFTGGNGINGESACIAGGKLEDFCIHEKELIRTPLPLVICKPATMKFFRDPLTFRP
jgi:hypothetical protein